MGSQTLVNPNTVDIEGFTNTDPTVHHTCIIITTYIYINQKCDNLFKKQSVINQVNDLTTCLTLQ